MSGQAAECLTSGRAYARRHGMGLGGDQAKAARGFGKGGELLCDPAMCQRIRG